MEVQGQSPKGPRTTLSQGEAFWRDHQKWLEDCGYMLRARYHSDWKPSWVGTKKPWLACEDAQTLPSAQVLDATRLSDGDFVMLKMVRKSHYPHEAEIGTFFSEMSLASDPSNHCVPIYDILHVPDDHDLTLLVMPLLRTWDDPRFDTFGEAVAFFKQIFEGLQFMHKHRVAHRDCIDLNIMMDAKPLYAKPYHPIRLDMTRDCSGIAVPRTRTQAPVKYYLVDFSISRQYSDDDIALEPPILGGDKTVPEFQASMDPCDPFPTDIYYLGNMIRQNFLEGSSSTSRKLGFEFMEALVADMVQDDPAKRPNVDEVVARFETIHQGLSFWKLRSRVVQEGERALGGFFRSIWHWARRIQFVVTGVPSVPMPS